MAIQQRLRYTVLCCYANFRTSYLRLDGITYTIRPGEWVCRVTDLLGWFRVRFQHQAISILSALQQLHLITYTKLGQGNLIKYHISYWNRHNPVLDYNCPCQKDTGFFFMPVSVLSKLIGTTRASEMDIILDLWLCTICLCPLSLLRLLCKCSQEKRSSNGYTGEPRAAAETHPGSSGI